MRTSTPYWPGIAVLAASLLLAADAPPAHPRLKQEKLPGKREKLSLGALFLPETLPPGKTIPLLIVFHGPSWIAEAAGKGKRAVLTVQLGSGSAVYGKPFTEAKRFGQLLAEAEKKAGRKFDPIGLTAWSAGYGAVRAILRHEEPYRRVRWVVLLDGLHAGYRPGKADEDRLVAADLDVYVRLARDAAAGRKAFLITHSGIVPSGYASTTECASYLIAQTGLVRKKAARSRSIRAAPGKRGGQSGTAHPRLCRRDGGRSHRPPARAAGPGGNRGATKSNPRTGKVTNETASFAARRAKM